MKSESNNSSSSLTRPNEKNLFAEPPSICMIEYKKLRKKISSISNGIFFSPIRKESKRLELEKLIENDNQFRSSLDQTLINFPGPSSLRTISASSGEDIRNIYYFKEELGGGNYGTVRKAVLRSNPDKHFAIKSIYKLRYKKNPSKLEELMREVDILSTLDHPHIIKFYETYHDKEYFHIVMDICTGRNIYQRIIENDMKNEEHIKIIIYKILSALKYLHENGIIHRDLKPQNIIFEKDYSNEIKIVDFGLSIRTEKDYLENRIIGTPYYISPEIINSISYDEKCDIWSVGIISYYLLSGNYPFTGQNKKELYRNILEWDVIYDESIWEGYTLSSIDFISSCLNKDPEKRLSASELLNHRWFSKLCNAEKSKTKLDRNVLKN